MTIPEMQRPLPSFQQWLEDKTDSRRGDGFEAMADLARRSQVGDAELAHLSPDEAAFARMWAGLSIAVVELCNIEHKKGRSPHETVQIMPRALAAAAFYSTASILEDDSPWRVIAKVLFEEFRFGTKTCADTFQAKLEAQGR